MAKFRNVLALLVVFFASFSFSQTASVDDLLGDPALVQKEIDCVLDRGHCDRIGNSLKASLEEVLGNDCRRCTQHQMVNALKIMEFMEKYHRPEWEEMVLKYQPNPQRRNFQSQDY